MQDKLSGSRFTREIVTLCSKCRGGWTGYCREKKCQMLAENKVCVSESLIDSIQLFVSEPQGPTLAFMRQDFWEWG